MIRVKIVSNVDKLRDRVWPIELVGVPHRGDRIRSSDSSRLEGIVTQITHCSDRCGVGTEVPYVEIYIDNAELRR